MSTPIHISIYSIKQYFLHRPVAVYLISLFAPRLNPFLNSELCDVCVCVWLVPLIRLNHLELYSTLLATAVSDIIFLFMFSLHLCCVRRARAVCVLFVVSRNAELASNANRYHSSCAIVFGNIHAECRARVFGEIYKYTEYSPACS